MSRFRPSHYVERVGREISVLKSGLNISGDFSRPKLCHFSNFETPAPIEKSQVLK